jgi:hypothetical protein
MSREVRAGGRIQSSSIPIVLLVFPTDLGHYETVVAAIREWRVGAMKCECNLVVEDTW